MNTKSKISKETQDELVRHYLAEGSKASAECCASLGLHPKYASTAAVTSGKFRGSRKRNDPRWEWAKARGAVIA